MPSPRKHQRHSPNGAAADAPKTACDQLASHTPCAEGGDLIDQTIAIWQKRTERKLTREDGREIIENISGFFSILQEWDRRERAAECAKAASSQNGNVGRRARRNKC
jgi:hypothetical protein